MSRQEKSKIKSESNLYIKGYLLTQCVLCRNVDLSIQKIDYVNTG